MSETNGQPMPDEHDASGDTVQDDAMNDEAPDESDAGPGPVPGEAWRDVISQVDALAEAVGRWTRAAVNDPENRRRAVELQEHIEGMARSVGDTIDGAVDGVKTTDVGAAVKGAASKTGDAFKSAGGRFTEEVAPRMASAFSGAATKLQQAAERMEAAAPPPPPPPPPEHVEAEVIGVDVETDSAADDAAGGTQA